MINNIKEKGITLIALVVTIIILLILAGVTIGFAVNGTGIFDKAKLATDKYNNEVDKESYELAKATNSIEDVIYGSRGNVTKTTLYDTITSATDSKNEEVTLNDNIRNYDYLVINIAWRYNNSGGNQSRQYFLDTEMIDIKSSVTNNNSDIMFDYGYNTTTDYVGLCFLNNNKLNIYLNSITSPYTVAVTKILGVKF